MASEKDPRKKKRKSISEGKSPTKLVLPGSMTTTNITGRPLPAGAKRVGSGDPDSRPVKKIRRDVTPTGNPVEHIEDDAVDAELDANLAAIYKRDKPITPQEVKEDPEGVISKDITGAAEVAGELADQQGNLSPDLQMAIATMAPSLLYGLFGDAEAGFGGAVQTASGLAGAKSEQITAERAREAKEKDSATEHRRKLELQSEKHKQNVALQQEKSRLEAKGGKPLTFAERRDLRKRTTSYGVAQTVKEAEQAKKTDDTSMDMLIDLEELLNITSVKGIEFLPGGAGSKAMASAASLQAKLKDQIGLGVLSKHDFDFLEKQIPSDPTGVAGTNMFGLWESVNETKLNTVKNSLIVKTKLWYDRRGLNAPDHIQETFNEALNSLEPDTRKMLKLTNVSSSGDKTSGTRKELEEARARKAKRDQEGR